MRRIIDDIKISIEALENGDNHDALYMLKEILQELEFKATINGW
mgnify:FL=1|jgi:hypothetical protein|tara:strand:- start:1260 stop:1391 length:132 start_codon:yes stop_codon:yes gene_type:complete